MPIEPHWDWKKTSGAKVSTAWQPRVAHRRSSGKCRARAREWPIWSRKTPAWQTNDRASDVRVCGAAARLMEVTLR